MPRFYFHLYNDLVAMDEEGLELPDLAAARETAKANIRDIMAELVKEDGRVTLQHRVEIADETGAIVATVPFRDAVAVEG
jgi:hypothetical protein